MEPQRVSATHSQTIWEIEPRYTSVQFSYKSFFFFTIKGRFTDFAATIFLDEDDIRRSSVEATIKAASINTGNKRRDRHLRSADFLDAEKHPEIGFQSTGVERGRDRDTLRVKGIVTIKGESREVMLDVFETDRSRSPGGEEVAYYTALVELDRVSFGLKYGRGLISRTIKVMIPTQATKKR